MAVSFRRSFAGLSVLAVSLALAGPIQAEAAASGFEPTSVSTPKGPLGAALLALGRQTGVQIIFTSRVVEGREAPALVGQFSVDEALRRLLAGSNLEAKRAGPAVLVIRERAGLLPTSSAAPPRDLITALTTDAVAPATPIQAADDATMLSEVVVGSHIRGVKDGASPVVVLSRQELEQDGRATIAEALAALPQNFGGSASEDTVSTGSDPLGVNASQASGVNLRGLGADATLVLVNGRRLAGTGLKGDFADVSSIPMSAVDRVEVLLDGASALYGSDAVGGVVNIVLRTRFDGGETRVVTGGATQGGATQFQFGQTVGKIWDSGHVVLSYEHAVRDRLRARDRPFAGNADLRSLGGTDHRWVYGSPGNILADNVPAYGIPPGQNGVGLTAASFLPGQINRENQQGGYDLLARQRRDGLYVAFGQNVTSAIEISGEARANQRRFNSVGGPANAAIQVDTGNPYFAAPAGETSETINYSFQRETGGTRDAGTADTLGFSLGALARLPAGWRLDAYGAYGVELLDLTTTNLLHTDHLDEATGFVPDNRATTFSTARDGYFNPFIGQGSNPRPMLDFLFVGFNHTKTRSQTRSANLKLDGNLWTLPAGAVGVAIGGQVRDEVLTSSGAYFLFGDAPVQSTSRRSSRSVNAAFAEIRVPLFSAANARPGLERLELSAAVRHEDYGGEVHSTDPKLGLIWSPKTGATIKASYGTSFRAPALTELTDRQLIAPTILYNGATQVISMLLYGGNADLRPETATSKALTLELAPPAWPNFKASGTLFSTRFENRIGQPGRENLRTVLSAAEFAPFRTFIAPATNPADLATIQTLIDAPISFAKGLFPATAYGAIIDARWVNTGQVEVEGLDLSASYATKVGLDPLVFSGSLSWLMDYKRKITPQAQAVQLAGMAGNPADLRLRGTAAWTHDWATTALSINRVGDLQVEGGGRIKAWTTADLNVRLTPRGSAWKGLTLALNIQNLFDQDPPFYDSSLGIGYDAANADPLGRVATLQLTKTW
jgi:iron complex outermembrane receptor protein